MRLIDPAATLMKFFQLFLMCGLTMLPSLRAAAPPFSGTIFIDPDIITASDRTTFTNLTFAGQGFRTMFDRRSNSFNTVFAYLFNVRFIDGLNTEVQVNPEFGSSGAAGVEANKYATVIGRLPTALRRQVATVWIHKGVFPFGGGNNNLLIHTGQADQYVAGGILEETFVHEASHTSLDGAHAASAGWLAVQSADPTFISTYARDNPTREDVAESFLTWLAIRHRSSRITATLSNTIATAIPNRHAYFDQQRFDLYPIDDFVPRLGVRLSGANVLLSWRDQPGYILERKATLASSTWVAVALAPVLNNGTNTVSITRSGSSSFFRLRK